MERLFKIQQELKAPKDQYNSYGEYNYRSAEGILEAVKPLLKETGTVLTLTDDVTQLGERYYVIATATLYDATTGKEIHHTCAMAREQEIKKGMDSAQITGSTSSYARKYALNALFAIDDVKDPDATNKHEDETKNNEISPDKTVCPKCGKKTTQGALTSWGMCGDCYRASKKEDKNAIK
jgi:hypothetical protein